MADSTIQPGMDILSRGTSYTSQTDFDAYINRWEEKEKEDALYEDRGTLSFTDMLGLMVAQFQNQTMDNQASTTDMMNQLVQMSSMQAMTEMTSNIKELALANVMTYAASLVGKTVTVGVRNEKTGEIDELVGVVQGTGTYDGQQVIYLENGKGYFLSDIMAVGTLPPKEETEEPGDSGDESTTTPPVDTENKDEAES
ncbi:MAG: flagellar hook capping FlgD N-terminal domain-containing protein [Oscillospiraceae bacterium]|nr:flagellar hook capping FlgD N-terminal domain-containing protein [Oscillospiraceae bacterium]